MPRDGSGNYTLPYVPVVDGTTIESAVHNGTMSDIALQLNGPVPIISGGTGANNAHSALINLKGEEAGQAVTNYDTHPFVAGSFYSLSLATSAPGPGGFSGICHPYVDPNFMTIEARTYTGTTTLGMLWIRQKNGGTWGPWFEQPGSTADLDARYVNVTGDTMTGALTVNADIHGADIYAVRGADVGYTFFGSGGGHYLGYTGANFAFVGGDVFVSSSTGSSSPTTGALTVTGGLGVSGVIMAGNDVYAMSPHAAGQPNVGSIASDYFSAPSYTGTFLRQGDHSTPGTGLGGLSSAGLGSLIFQNGTGAVIGSNTAAPITFAPTNVKAMEVGSTKVDIPLTTASSSPTTGALTVAGGVGVGGSVCIGNSGGYSVVGQSVTTGNSRFDVIGPTTGTNPGALIGAISGSTTLLMGTYSAALGGAYNPQPVLWSSSGSIYFANSTASTSTATGALTVAGGAGIAGRVTAGGQIASAQQLISAQNTTDGTVFFGSNLTNFLTYSSGNFTLGGGQFFCSRVFGTGFVSRQGETGATNPLDVHNHYWTTAVAQFWINNTNLGNVTLTSDYRIKKDVLDLPGMWDKVKALRPIQYTHQDYTPQSETERRVQMVADARKNGDDAPWTKEGYAFPPFSKGDTIEHWGFIAHEVQDTLTPSVASGVKDAPDAIQALNIDGIVAALTKALQEAMARIEALEAR